MSKKAHPSAMNGAPAPSGGPGVLIAVDCGDGTTALVDPNTGLTAQEQQAMNALLAFFQMYTQALPVQHQADMSIVVQAVQMINSQFAMRVARRHWPKGWPAAPQPQPAPLLQRVPDGAN